MIRQPKSQRERNERDRLILEEGQKPILDRKIEHTTLSTRSKNALIQDGFKTIRDVVNSDANLLRIPYLGHKYFEEIEAYIKDVKIDNSKPFPHNLPESDPDKELIIDAIAIGKAVMRTVRDYAKEKGVRVGDMREATMQAFFAVCGALISIDQEELEKLRTIADEE